MRLLPQGLAVVAVLAAVVSGALFVAQGSGDEAAPSGGDAGVAMGSLSPSSTVHPTVPSPEEIQAVADELNAIQAAETAEPYSGPLGDFIVYSGDMPPSDRICLATEADSPPPHSELFFTLPNGATPDEAYVCEDGTAVWMSGTEGGVSVQREYFTAAKPGVFLDAPLERITLMTVGGRPAILTRPLPEVDRLAPTYGLRRSGAVERFPSGDGPGVLLCLDGLASEEQIVATAEYVIGQGAGEE